MQEASYELLNRTLCCIKIDPVHSYWVCTIVCRRWTGVYSWASRRSQCTRLVWTTSNGLKKKLKD